MNAVIDWMDLALLDAIIGTGTLAAAGRRLGVDQTTASRRLARIEKRLGSRMFDRIDGRLVPTPVLGAALGSISTLSEAARLAETVLLDKKSELDGRVRISSIGFFLAHVLAPKLASLHAEHPALRVDLVAEDRSVSFEQRETDVAVRFAAPGEDSAVMRRLGSMPFGLYRPVAGPEAPNLVVRYGEELDYVPEMRALERLRPNSMTILRSNRLDILIEAACSLGAELMLPELLARADPRFVRSAEPCPEASRVLYLLVHADRRGSPSVAAVISWITTAFRTALAAG